MIKILAPQHGQKRALARTSVRTIEKRRTLTLGFMELIHELFNIPVENMYVTLTEHKGEDFHLFEKYLASWQAGEDPLAD